MYHYQKHGYGKLFYLHSGVFILLLIKER